MSTITVCNFIKEKLEQLCDQGHFDEFLAITLILGDDIYISRAVIVKY